MPSPFIASILVPAKSSQLKIEENKAKSPRMKVKNKVFEGVTVMFYNVGAIFSLRSFSSSNSM